MLNINRVKQDFPIFKHNPSLVYLDSAATSLKPSSVIGKLVEYYQKYPASVGRGIYDIAQRATEEYEATRKIVACFINAEQEEIIFTRNTTESINLLAYTLGEKIIKKNDEIIISIMEHHSNFVPWQQLAIRKKANIRIIDINNQGYLDLSLKKIVNKKTKIVALTYASNVLGTINNIKKITEQIKKINPNTIIIIDAAQAVPHVPINVKKLGIDFLVFSAHKMLGPTGVGILWGKKNRLNKMPPFIFGGNMIREVSIKKTTLESLPYKFEAGTPSIGEIIAFKNAILYFKKIGFKNILEYERKLIKYSMDRFKKEFNDTIKILGPKKIQDRVGVISFTFKNYHPHDIAQILSEQNICVRAGHHCAMPLHTRLKIPASTRISFYIYNTKSDVDKLIIGLKRVNKILN